MTTMLVEYVRLDWEESGQMTEEMSDEEEARGTWDEARRPFL